MWLEEVSIGHLNWLEYLVTNRVSVNKGQGQMLATSNTYKLNPAHFNNIMQQLYLSLSLSLARLCPTMSPIIRVTYIYFLSYNKFISASLSLVLSDKRHACVHWFSSAYS